ncbi:DUF2971 domain-containing protein [Pantoea sp. y20]
MSKLFYRFRSMESLLGEYKELESQTIFFAEPKTLNDPMEGLRDVFWLGDEVVWINLFKNYILCLERMCSLVKIGGEERDVTDLDLPVFSGEMDFPTKMYKELFLLIVDGFLNNDLIGSLAKKLSKRTFPVRRDELFLYLEKMHMLALFYIDSIYSKNGLGKIFNVLHDDFKRTAELSLSAVIDDDLISKVEDVALNEEDGVRKVELLLKTLKSNQSDMVLSRQAEGAIPPESRNMSFMVFNFPEKYLSQLERLLFPEWYTACFMTQCHNSSIWGHYGKNHTGACLIFESEEIDSAFYLNLKGINGFNGSGYTYSFVKNKFYEIDYIEGVGEVDFFRMLGRLPIPKLNSVWYMHEGKRSSCADEMRESIESWRKKYWDYFYRDITRKTDDWVYENEYRLILSGMMLDFSDPKHRALNYKFSSLKGIIFGIKTSLEDKLKLIEVIKMKINENEYADFKFYQAYYDSDKKSIGHIELWQLNRSLKKTTA